MSMFIVRVKPKMSRTEFRAMPIGMMMPPIGKANANAQAAGQPMSMVSRPIPVL
jgi:hypothetical protein